MGPLIRSSQRVTPVSGPWKRTTVLGPGPRLRLRQRPSYLGLSPRARAASRADLQVFRGAVAVIGRALGQQAVDIFPIEAQPLGLVVRAFVPLEAQPVHGIQNFFDKLCFGTFLIGIFDAQDKGAVKMAGDEPVEQGGMGAAQMQRARGARGKTGPYFSHHIHL